MLEELAGIVIPDTILRSVDFTTVWVWTKSGLVTCSLIKAWVLLKNTSHWVHVDQPQVPAKAMRQFLEKRR